jgi:hypothetical protein
MSMMSMPNRAKYLYPEEALLLDGASTAAPSPALSALASPPFSPWNSALLAARFSAPASWDTLLGSLTPPPPLKLPAAQISQEDTLGAFELEGLQGLQQSLATILAQHLNCEAQNGLPPSKGHSYGFPIAPPPGLEGLVGYDNEINTPEADDFEESPVSCNAAALSAECTTVMLRNIPNKYTRERLAARLQEEGFLLDMDFLYLPIDFRNLCNVGYAFLSFRTPEACRRFADEFHQRNATEKLPGFNSKKVCEVSEARCQGREENVRRLQGSPVMQQLIDKPEWLPLLFSVTGEVEEFPLTKALKARAKQANIAQRAPAGRIGRKNRVQDSRPVGGN